VAQLLTYIKIALR